MATLGEVSVKLLAQIGNAEPLELGTVSIPLRAEKYEKGYKIELDGPFEAVREMIRRVFDEEAAQ